MRTTIVIFLAMLLWSSSAHAECRSSANAAYSFDVRLSPAAGCMCLMVAEVFAGPDCRPQESRWSETFGCNVTDRMAVTDQGNLVSILAPATAHRDWSIVAVHSWRDGRVVGTWLSLDEIPGTEVLHGVVRPVFDGAAIRFSADVVVAFTVLEAAAP
jgi:hypothetical protein